MPQLFEFENQKKKEREREREIGQWIMKNELALNDER